MGKEVRLDKFLADAGVGTRSEVKKLIQKGQILVNSAAVKRPEEKVRVPEDKVFYQGKEISAPAEFEYYLLNKPAGCVSAVEDARDKTVMDYVPSERKGLFPVGRLDKDTEGLLLITDDGVLAHELLSPKKHVEKTYYAVVDGQVTEADVLAMGKGVDIGEKHPTLPARLEILSVKEMASVDKGSNAAPSEKGQKESPFSLCSSWQSEIRLTICEGKFHQVKRMMETVGKRVVYLKRISMGPLVLPPDLEKGKCRPLTDTEVENLKKTSRNH